MSRNGSHPAPLQVTKRRASRTRRTAKLAHEWTRSKEGYLMKRVITGTFLATAFAVGLSAQSTPPQSAPQTPPTSAAPTQEARDSAKNVTVTGCLKAGDTADSYILSDLKWNKDKDKTTGAGAVGTSGSAPSAIASATTLKLNPGAGTKLSDHVGHQVEVTGSVSDKSASAAPTSPADSAAARPAKAEAALDVRNVKMIAATCTM